MKLPEWPEKPSPDDCAIYGQHAFTCYHRARAEAAIARLSLLVPLLAEANGGLRDYIDMLERHNGASLYYGKDLMKRVTEALAQIGLPEKEVGCS